MGPNKASIALTAFFLIGGIVFWVTLPEIWLGQIWVGVGLFLLVLQVWMKVKTDQAWATGSTASTQIPKETLEALQNLSVSRSTSSATMGADVGQQIVEALKAQGIDTTNGTTVDLTNMPQARDAVLKALQLGGIDIAHQLAVAAPAIPIQGSGEPMERMTKLEQLKTAGLISNEEFEQNRKRILQGL